jgi:hypothetical protein
MAQAREEVELELELGEGHTFFHSRLGRVRFFLTALRGGSGIF